jgi:hypothetical protein
MTKFRKTGRTLVLTLKILGSISIRPLFSRLRHTRKKKSPNQHPKYKKKTNRTNKI